MNDIWEEIWDIINEAFRRIAVSLSNCCPTISWSSGHSDNKAFPFRAYATFNQDPSALGEVVVSIDFRKSEDGLRYSTDIGRDDGTVLADGPAGVIDVSEGVASARDEIATAVLRIVRFLDEAEQVVRGVIIRQSE
jgi:hypothetical protein